MAFSKLKALLRAKAERSVDALWDTVGKIVPLIKPQECANYFAAAGYDPDQNGRALGRTDGESGSLRGLGTASYIRQLEQDCPLVCSSRIEANG